MKEIYKRNVYPDSNPKGKILLIGIGGVGTNVFLNMIGLGINFDAVDNDRVEPSNLNRQWIYDLNCIGIKKIDCAKKLLLNRNKEINSNYYLDFKNIDFKNYSLIIDATDNFKTRREISLIAKKSKRPLIYASAEEFRYSVGRFSEVYPHEIFLGRKKLLKEIFPPAATIAGAIATQLIYEKENMLIVGDIRKYKNEIVWI